jgi:2-polyprenyl-3-methyl-5-hydroxy-6-metoxy-1,4-benzoquinol methylase
MWPAYACAVHQHPLREDSGTLCCPAGHFFAIVRGIPRFVSGSSYAEAFGEQWKRYRKTQLDSYTKTTISRDRLRRCLGEETWHCLKGKHVLECGCGAGRFTEILLAQGACVTSIDLSEAVDANAENCPPSATHRIAQADIEALPFLPHGFDVVLCLGVIQHTPNPERTIAHLAQQVKPGGALVIDHYTLTLSRATKSAPLIRQIAKRLSPKAGIRLTEWLVRVFYPLHESIRFRPTQMLLSRISPVMYYGYAFPQLSRSLLREWALLDTHDSLTDSYRHFRTKRQIHRAIERTGLTRIWCEKGGNGVEARAYRL